MTFTFIDNHMRARPTTHKCPDCDAPLFSAETLNKRWQIGIFCRACHWSSAFPKQAVRAAKKFTPPYRIGAMPDAAPTSRPMPLNCPKCTGLLHGNFSKGEKDPKSLTCKKCGYTLDLEAQAARKRARLNPNKKDLHP